MALDWNEKEMYFYYAGIANSDYPGVIWEKILPHLNNCSSLIDIGCGPGAFTLKALEDGFNVTSVDSNLNSIEVLSREIQKRNLHRNSSIVLSDWNDIKAGKFDVSIAAYCFYGSIGSKEGIEKIISCTNVLAVFILPARLQKSEFFSDELYKKLNMEAPVFNENDTLDNIMEAAKISGKKVSVEEIEYDFGIPCQRQRDMCVSFLCDKLEIKNRHIIEEHIRNIKTYRNGMEWLPNIRKSLLIMCHD